MLAREDQLAQEPAKRALRGWPRSRTCLARQNSIANSSAQSRRRGWLSSRRAYTPRHRSRHTAHRQGLRPPSFGRRSREPSRTASYNVREQRTIWSHGHRPMTIGCLRKVRIPKIQSYKYRRYNTDVKCHRANQPHRSRANYVHTYTMAQSADAQLLLLALVLHL